MNADQYAEKQQKLFEDSNIPEELQGALSYMAYESGHAFGYDEIYCHLADYVCALEDPIQKLIKRLAEK